MLRAGSLSEERATRYGLTIWAVLGLAGAGAGTTAWAQAQPPHQVRIIGRVFDEARRLVQGAEVVVNGREVRAMTDAAGLFQLDVLPTDSTIGFRRIGYRPMLLTIHPLPLPRDTILVELVTSPVRLPEVIISGSPSKPLRYAGTTKYDEVFLRQKVGLGTVIPREAIERRFGAHTEELLQGIPGVRVWNGPPKRIRFARCQDPRAVSVFIDGILQNSARGSGVQLSGGGGRPERGISPGDEEPIIEILSQVNPSDIEMIEVYRGASQIPGVFHWDGCAVIAIWTRWNE